MVTAGRCAKEVRYSLLCTKKEEFYNKSMWKVPSAYVTFIALQQCTDLHKHFVA
jgi:hypothetical protein